MKPPLPRRIRVPNHRAEEAIQSVWQHAGGAIGSLWHWVETLGFWVAVLIPLAYPVVLIGRGWLSESWIPLIGVLAVHVLALFVGRDRGRARS